MVDMWVLFINNFSYRTLGMDENSSYDSLIVAIVVTSCSLIIIGSGLNLISYDVSRPPEVPHVTVNTSQVVNQSLYGVNRGKYPDNDTIKLISSAPISEPNTTKPIDSVISKTQTDQAIKVQPLVEQKKIKNVEDYFVSVKTKKRHDQYMSNFDQSFRLNPPKKPYWN
jgi:hypothetical protein